MNHDPGFPNGCIGVICQVLDAGFLVPHLILIVYALVLPTFQGEQKGTPKGTPPYLQSATRFFLWGTRSRFFFHSPVVLNPKPRGRESRMCVCVCVCWCVLFAEFYTNTCMSLFQVPFTPMLSFCLLTCGWYLLVSIVKPLGTPSLRAIG